MPVINSNTTVAHLNKLCKDTLISHIGIEITQVGDDYLEAKMPVDKRTHQPFGMLHGGASVVLAETLGSLGANCCIDTSSQYAVGIEINANHIKSASKGYVYGISQPIHLGKKTHIWEIKIYNEQKDIICVSRITLAIIDKK